MSTKEFERLNKIAELKGKFDGLAELNEIFERNGIGPGSKPLELLKEFAEKVTRELQELMKKDA